MPRAVNEQVVVVTGASSGLGRETALQFGKRGASVVVAARNGEALEAVADDIDRLGGKAVAVPTDVAQWEQVRALTERAVAEFGRVDTWVNAAAVSLYGTVEQITVEEIARVMQVIFMGQVHGMKAVLPHMKQRGSGTIVNVASALAVRSVPLQSAYCAAKHALRGFSESLRMELEHEGVAVNVTLVMPSSINTPLFAHARSKLGKLPKPIPPVYEPRVVAESILFAAQHPRREIVVGGGGKMLTVGERLSPELVDRFMLGPGKAFAKQQAHHADDGTDNLFEASSGLGSTTGQFGKKSKSTSVYTRYLEQHPQRKRALAASAAAATVALLLRRDGNGAERA